LEQKKCGSGCVEWKGFKDDILSKFRRCVNGMDEECECGRYVAVKSDIGNSMKSGTDVWEYENRTVNLNGTLAY